ncbi:MAG: AdeC/AdeK/OprM family multidrug efflux complex outer membrane factor [Parvibaculaceae bacterium]|nr:AdeC/AdeK/OprM family multidrug efflux complex outer membrane factor [Parvibaculaceae bacterium]
MTKLTVPLSLAAVLLTAGCTLIPDYLRPEAPVAAAWPTGPAYQADAAGADKNASQPAAIEIGWRNFFTDPDLQKLIGLSLSNNRDLRVAVLNIEQARAQYQVQRADLLPKINGVADGTRQRLPADLSQTGRSGISSDYSVGLGVTAFELDFFGRVRSLKEEALNQYLATGEARRSAQISLVAEVADGYLTLLSDRDQLALAQSTLKSQQDYYQLITARYNGGVASELDLRQAETQVNTAEVNVAQFSRLVALDLNALTLLVGGPLPENVVKADSTKVALTDQNFLEDLPAGLPSDLLTRRPDVVEAEYQLKAANANIGAARAAFFPSITLTGNIGTASSQLSGLFDGGSGAWSFAPQLNLPIFDTGSNIANLDLAKVQKNIQIAQYEKTIQTAFREVSDGLASRGTLSSQLASQQSLVNADQRSYDLAQARYDAGVEDYLVVLTSQQQLFQAQQNLISTRLLRLSNLVDLYKSLGGGWVEKTGDKPAPADVDPPAW